MIILPICPLNAASMVEFFVEVSLNTAVSRDSGVVSDVQFKASDQFDVLPPPSHVITAAKTWDDRINRKIKNKRILFDVSKK